MSHSNKLILTLLISIFISLFSGVKLYASEAVPNEYIVKVKPVLKNFSTFGFSAMGVEKMEPIPLSEGFFLIKTNVQKDQKVLLRQLAQNENIEYVEPNYIYSKFKRKEVQSAEKPSDPAFAYQWGFENTGQLNSDFTPGTPGMDIGILPLWREGVTEASQIKVAVIDTGVQWEHPDLKQNIYVNPFEIPGNGIDDDVNGYIDDIHGWNFANGNAQSSDDDKEVNHGTHCAGTIGAVGDNGVGIAGMAWNVKIIPVKYLNHEGVGLTSNAIQSLQYARLMGARIMSISWGSGKYSKSLEAAIKKTRDAGIVIVAAAGNDGEDNDQTPMYPASYEVNNIISVAALNNEGDLADFSNWGKKNVDVAAPGVDILSTVFDGKYEFYSGTSMATPFVAGVAALILAQKPRFSYLDVKNRLIKTSTFDSRLDKKIVANGRINAYNAVHGIITK